MDPTGHTKQKCGRHLRVGSACKSRSDGCATFRSTSEDCTSATEEHELEPTQLAF